MAGLSPKRQAFVEEYLRSWNATSAALAAGYSDNTAGSQGQRLLKNVEIQQAVEQRLKTKAMGTDEVLARLSDQARSDMGVFFIKTERWTEWPTPTQEIIDTSIEVDDKGREHTNYKVRTIIIDLDKLLDPRYSRLIKKFVDSPKNGLSLELYDAQAALNLIGRNLGLFKDRLELTGKDGAPFSYKVTYTNDWRHPAAEPAPGTEGGAAVPGQEEDSLGGAALAEDNPGDGA